MQSVHKPFDKELFAKYDEAGKKKVADFMEWSWGVTVVEGSTYGIDLVAKRNDTPVGFVEVEVRNWKGDECPFDTINVPVRKAQLLKDSTPSFLFSVHSNLKVAYWCTAEDILVSPKVEVPNKEIGKGEFFFKVPLTSFRKVRFVI